MELQHLKYFQVTARLQHMTRASEQLKISQPALSKSISLLENELGVNLFDRNGHRIQLNYYGETFLKRADAILNLVEISEKELKEMSGNEITPVKLSVFATSNLLPDILGKFRKIHPHISFRLVQEMQPEDDFDLRVTSTLFPPKAPNHKLLLYEEIFLGVASSHPLAKYDSVYLKDVADEDFITLRKGENFREITDTFCTYASFSPRIIFECTSPMTSLELIRGGHGIGFTSEKSAAVSNYDSIKLLHIKDLKCGRYLEVYWPADKYVSKSARLFCDFLQTYFAERFSTPAVS